MSEYSYWDSDITYFRGDRAVYGAGLYEFLGSKDDMNPSSVNECPHQNPKWIRIG